MGMPNGRPRLNSCINQSRGTPYKSIIFKLGVVGGNRCGGWEQAGSRDSMPKSGETYTTHGACPQNCDIPRTGKWIQ